MVSSQGQWDPKRFFLIEVFCCCGFFLTISYPCTASDRRRELPSTRFDEQSPRRHRSSPSLMRQGSSGVAGALGFMRFSRPLVRVYAWKGVRMFVLIVLVLVVS